MTKSHGNVQPGSRTNRLTVRNRKNSHVVKTARKTVKKASVVNPGKVADAAAQGVTGIKHLPGMNRLKASRKARKPARTRKTGQENVQPSRSRNSQGKDSAASVMRTGSRLQKLPRPMMQLQSTSL